MYEYYALNQNRKTNRTIKNNTLHNFEKKNKRSLKCWSILLLLRKETKVNEIDEMSSVGGKNRFCLYRIKLTETQFFCTKSFFLSILQYSALPRKSCNFISITLRPFHFSFLFLSHFNFFSVQSNKKVNYCSMAQSLLLSLATHQRVDKTIYYYRRNKNN